MPSPFERLGQRDPWLYVQDMLDFAETVLRYAAYQTQAELEVDRMRWDAILRNLELLGEAANRVPIEVQSLAPELPWRTLVAVRNRLAHAYLTIEPDVVDRIVRNRCRLCATRFALC